MANSYSKIYIHLILVVKNRASFIQKAWKEELFKYITGIVQNKGHKLVAIGGVADHIHILIGLNVNEKISDLVKAIKNATNGWINDRNLTSSKFYWQQGYGAFSHSHGNLDTVAKYVLKQEEHHRKKTFKEEYKNLLKEFEVEYKEEYLFEFLDEG
ncbi:MAG: IS200/IS605 family transposase [Saprospiraceae bacterium]|nr:IS200/IS605 family transposase [Saprospiraceae bacterium]